MKKTALKILLILLITNSVFAQESIEELKGYGEFVEARMAEWGVPGAAVGIVKDGQVVFSQGFGYRDRENKLPVNERTLFPIGSCSKAFTAMSAAIAADKGLLAFDNPIVNHLPGLELNDPYTSEKVTIRDLLLHRSGIGRNDLMTHSVNYPRAELIKRFKHVPMAGNFRERHIYSNLGFILAGYTVGAANDSSWEEFVKANILNPLNMKDTIFSSAEMQQKENYAKAYIKDIADIDGEAHSLEIRDWGVNAPAGGVISNLNDMVVWLKLHLNSGRYGENEIVSNNNFRALLLPAIGRGYYESGPKTSSATGMGWNIYHYRSHYLVMHTGIVNGYCASVAFLPREKTGVVVLTNMKMHSLQEILAYNAIDRMLGLEPVDYNSSYKSQWASIAKMFADDEVKQNDLRVSNTKPSLEIGKYTGVYTHPAVGKLEITKDKTGLHASFNDKVSVDLDHYHYDIWNSDAGYYSEFNDLKFHFIMNTSGQIESLRVGNDFTATVEFKKE